MKVLVAFLVLAQVAYAQTDAAIAYRVKKGDTLDVIAAEFYGDRTRAQFIVAENKLKNRAAFTPGDRLRIPVTREIATAKGDTFESLATTYLGDAKRAPFLADFNNLPADDALATGTTIVIPVHVTYAPPAPESLAQVATAFFGDAKQADVLRRFNALDKPQLDKGDTIVIPDLAVRVRAGKLPPLDAEAKQRHDEQVRARDAAADAVPRARSAWWLGDFAAVRAELDPIAKDADYLDTPTLVECGLLLGKAHIAFGEDDAAIKAFALVLDRKPRQSLSPYAESPKVIAAWKKAGGHVDGE